MAIARLLRNGEGERVHVPSTGDEAVRDYLRCRDDVRQEVRRYRQRLQQSLIRHGHVYRGGRNWTQGYRRWLDELEFSEVVLGETVQVYYRRIQELEEKLGLMDLRIQELASSAPYAEPVARLRCFRGIDYLTALAIVVVGARVEVWATFGGSRARRRSWLSWGWYPASGPADRGVGRERSPRPATAICGGCWSRQHGTTGTAMRRARRCARGAPGCRRR